jgi:hypothetical protein
MSDWHCINCNFKVFGRKSSCSKCGITRLDSQRRINERNESKTNDQPGATYKTAIQDVSEQIFDVKDKLTDQEFKSLLDTLKTCYASAPNQSLSSSSFSASPFAATPTTQPVSQPSVLQQPQQSGDWFCTNCNFVVFARKQECSKCKQRRPY